MQKGMFIKDIVLNSQVSGIFAVLEPELSQSRNGPYWRMKLSDRSGIIDANIWYPASTKYTKIASAILAFIKGKASQYRDKPQISIDQFEPLEESTVNALNIADFIPLGPYNPDEMFQELETLADTVFCHPGWRKLVGDVLADPVLNKHLKTFPAAVKIHHAYTGGLLEHTLGVFKLCMNICDLYTELDRQTLLAGALLHDIGKLREFSGGIANNYTDDGKLLGHIYLGLELIRDFVKNSCLEENLVQHLYHLILSHHGRLEYGAVRLPQTAEAFALHYADNMDARLAQCRALFSKEETAAPAWSSWQNSLERSIFLAASTPQTEAFAVQNNVEPSEAQGLQFIRAIDADFDYGFDAEND